MDCADKAISTNQQTDLTAVLTELNDIAVKLAAQNISRSGHIADGIQVTGSEDKLSRAILNILDNAVKYADKETVSIFSVPNSGLWLRLLIQAMAF